MAPPLTRIGPKGVFERSPEVEREIDALLVLPTREIRTLLATAEGQTGWITNEALTHLVRDARRRGDQVRMDAVIPAWIRRCEQWLSRENVDVIDEALGQLAEWLADGSSNLDFYEVRFGLALTAIRVNSRRKIRRRRAEQLFEPLNETHDVELPTATEDPTGILERHERVRAAIERLEDPIRQAAILVWVMELTQVAAAQRLAVTDRTIRNYLTAARVQLREILEES